MEQAGVTANKQDYQKYIGFIGDAIDSYANNDGQYLPGDKFISLMAFKQNIQNSGLMTPYDIEELANLVGIDIAEKIIYIAKNRVAIGMRLRGLVESGVKVNLFEN